MSDITVHVVSTTAEKKRFIRVTKSLYQDDANWIQPLDIERLEALDPKKNPFFDHAKVQLFIAQRDGVDVGRISATYDHDAQEKWGPDLGYFGHFEADSLDVARALMDTALDWLKTHGVKTVQGPWSLSPKEECGLLVDGFDTPPTFLMPHGKPVYADWLAELGFAKAHDLYAYQLDLNFGFPEKTMRFVDAAKRNSKLTIRPLDKKNYARDVALIVDIVEEAWADNWGFTAFTKAEGDHMASQMKPVLNHENTFFTEYESKPIGFMITIPDINDDIKDFDGKLFPFNIFRLLKRRILSKKLNRVRVPLMGVRKEFQKSRIGACAAYWMIAHSRQFAQANGATWGELGWILDENEGMNAILHQIDSEIYKTYRIFEQKLPE